MHSSHGPLSVILFTMAALCGSGCGDADNQPAPKSADEWRETWKAAKEDAQRDEAKQQEEIRKNEERIKALRAENEALRKQLEATQPTPPAPAKP